MEASIRAALLMLAALGADADPSPTPRSPLVASGVAKGPPSLDGLWREAPRTTVTRDGVAGDPLNVTLVGTREELLAAFCAAGWYPADPITLRSSLRISVSVVLNVPYPRAPVSDLYLWCRPQDLAFQQPCGRSARKRHHVRFWQSGVGPDGRPVWLGAGTFDVSVGRSNRTGRLTHHIDPDVDRERDKIMGDLRQAGVLAEPSLAPWTGPRRARNGGGDCYFTDGNMAVGVLLRRCFGGGRFPVLSDEP